MPRLLERHRPAAVATEACALAGWAHDPCAGRGDSCKVANTAGEAWEFKRAKRQAGKDGAPRLAQREALGPLPTAAIPPAQARRRRGLIAYRQVPVGRRRACQDRRRALPVGQGLPAPRGHRAWAEVGPRGVGRQARPLAECAADALWRGLLGVALTECRQPRRPVEQAEAELGALARAGEGVRPLEGIPGVGTRTAGVVVAHLRQPRRSQGGKQVSADVGLAPKQSRSGEAGRRGRVTRRGPAVLRKLPVGCAWGMPRHNGRARAAYRRLGRGRARQRQAIAAPARKPPVRRWAMPRGGPTPSRARRRCPLGPTAEHELPPPRALGGG